ncbi:MAG: sensor histidine kinase [Lachnospiraceae bacterium]|nr:sensor histidine kinase [Lachnospiraceae bacterium]MDE7176306.1 sensor histidine kinase [Lachnospiraceae bacterium]
MTVREFILDRLERILFHIALLLVIAAFLLMTGTQSGIVTLLLIACLLIYLLALLTDYWRTKKQLNELQAIMNELDQRYLFTECAPKPHDLYERKLFDLLRLSGKSMIESVSDARAAGKEYREYVEQWVHEIKTPITAAKLVCENIDSDTRRKLSQELEQIDAHVERALFYARSENPEKDFIIRKTVLTTICDRAIQTHRTLLIQNGVRVETENLDEIVYTDGKWVTFMIGQLLQNAARYRSAEPVIMMSAKKLGRQVQLTVQDNGIGIPAHELTRVFDRGFTGRNGRNRGGSTGMGLYLCKRLADAMEIGLQMQSTVGKGTCVTLTFPAEMNLSKM